MENKWKWYVIQVISGTEENVKQSLFQRRETFSLQDYILDVFVPTHDIVSVRAGWNKVKRKKNIFPWYILVQMVVTNESWYIVRNTPNVTWLLWAGNVPVPVSWEELNQLKWMLSANSESFETKHKVWDMATIVKWPFEGNEWVISEINDKKWYVKLNINLLGRDTPIELDFSQIKVK
jgi:transcriptional antiterminator NusG